MNENVRYCGVKYHIQTEDKGINNPSLVSIIFYGGTIIAIERICYKEIIGKEDIEKRITELLNGLHRKMIEALRGGAYDEKIKAYVDLKKPAVKDAPSLSCEERELIGVVKNKVLPSLREELGIDLTREELVGLRRAISKIPEGKVRDRILCLYSEVYSIIRNRCDRDEFKALVKKWPGVGKGSGEGPSGVKPVRSAVEKVTQGDMSEVIGDSLTSALYEKLFNEIHDSFFQKKGSVEIVFERLLNSGVIQKRTSPEWRNRMRNKWKRGYREFLGGQDKNA